MTYLYYPFSLFSPAYLTQYAVIFFDVEMGRAKSCDVVTASIQDTPSQYALPLGMGRTLVLIQL